MKNQVQIIGNVGKSPESNAKTKDGKPVVRFAVAQDVSGIDASTRKLVKRDTQWFQVSAFGNTAERALTLQKGDLIQIQGKLKSSAFQTDKGEKRSSVEIVADQIYKMTLLKKFRDPEQTESDDPAALDSADFDTFETGATL